MARHMVLTYQPILGSRYIPIESLSEPVWTNISMENHHFQWVNPVFQWPFSLAFSGSAWWVGLLPKPAASLPCWSVSRKCASPPVPVAFSLGFSRCLLHSVAEDFGGWILWFRDVFSGRYGDDRLVTGEKPILYKCWIVMACPDLCLFTGR